MFTSKSKYSRQHCIWILETNLFQSPSKFNHAEERFCSTRMRPKIGLVEASRELKESQFWPRYKRTMEGCLLMLMQNSFVFGNSCELFNDLIFKVGESEAGAIRNLDNVVENGLENEWTTFASKHVNRFASALELFFLCASSSLNNSTSREIAFELDIASKHLVCSTLNLSLGEIFELNN